LFNHRFLSNVFLISLISIFSHQIYYSQQYSYSSSDIIQGLNKLKVLGSVLYIAAHPDDENTSVLTYMSKGKLTRTAYLSLTRGDGGQNLLGNEKGDLLGVIRTQELLSARRIDGAEQFFTRAIDFGYSKTPSETLNNWDRELILGDIVKVIREFRPDIILTRFSKTQGGHGHHLTSAILAEEAFYAAADPNKYTEQLKNLNPWQAKRLYWNTFRPTSKALSIDIGEYNPVIGKSFNEISAKSRSMHKSQGFGVSPSRGSQLAQFDYFAGDTAKLDLFDNIDITWGRVEGGYTIDSEIDKIIEKYEEGHPEVIIQDLVKVYGMLDKLNDEYWISVKKKEITELVKMCSGLWMESIVWEPEISLGKAIDVRSMIVNRSPIPITLEKVITTLSSSDINYKELLEQNKRFTVKQIASIPNNYKYSQPYWLQEDHDGKMFTVTNPEQVGLAENGHEVSSKFILKIEGQLFTYDVPTLYRWNDAVKGEQTRPFIIRPDISISIDQSSYVFPNGRSHDIRVNIVSKIDSAVGKLYADLPDGWKSEPNYFNFDIQGKGNLSTYVFNVSPDENAKTGKANIRAEMFGKSYTEELVEIDYSHIPFQTALKPVKVDLIKLDIEVEPRQIGYIMGSGDDIPLSLTQLGYDLELLSDDDLDKKNLSEYDVIICGVRAFNTREELGRQQQRIIEFVENGGTWIVQHNTRFGIQVNQIGPYPFSATGRDRIAEESAKIEILIPDHQIFNYPNKIDSKDFEGWVQERGLYFAESWEGKLYPLLAGSDSGEPSKLGGLLYTNYGKGAFIFTAYSWFRQLPAGVSGAYRLFVNMISAKGKQ
jgi:LmbE family N-acetylglucosaminyl deacetylase